MGATVTCDKRAAAFATDDGAIHYILFENTYEKNCYPHTPHWSCTSIGDLSTTLQRLFLYGSGCEGGMLQPRSGHITPEGYIRGWLKELSAPVRFDDRSLTLRTGDSLYVSVPTGALDEISARLVRGGKTAEADALRSTGQANLSLYENAVLLSSIYDGRFLAPWKLLESHMVPLYGDRDPNLGYRPVADRKAEFDPPRAFRVDEHSLVLQRTDGSWFCAGWQYSIVGEYVRSLGETELTSPGSYHSRIRNFRKALEEAPPIPTGATVTIDESVELNAWSRQQLEEMKQKFAVTPTATGFKIVPSEDNMYEVTHLDPRCATWDVPGGAAAPSQSLAALPPGPARWRPGHRVSP